MDDKLDKNIEQLLKKAPEPEAAREGAQEKIFSNVMSRLQKDTTVNDSGPAPAPANSASVMTIGRLWRIAATLLLICGGAWLLLPSQTQTQTTGPEKRDIQIGVTENALVFAENAAEKHLLKDGSSITIAKGSRVKVSSWDDRSRPLVELLAGEVACRVAEGKGRFRVKTPAGEAVALGTEFTVCLEEESAEDGGAGMTAKDVRVWIMAVSVLSGQVLVSGVDGMEKLAVTGDTVSMKKIDTPIDNVRSGQLVPRLADGTRGKPLEIRRHTVNVTIRDQVAFVEVEQVFYNPTADRIEGTFHFPLPNGATICRLAMYVGDNLMEGEIAEAARARRTFEALKVQRIDPALLEWAGGNNFKMRVYPIESKSEKRVLISYYQVLEKDFDKINFHYPLASDALQTHPVGKIEVSASIYSTPSVVSADTPGLKARVNFESEHVVKATYTAEKVNPKEDFKLTCLLSKGQGELVVLPYWHAAGDDGYFLMIFSPDLKDFQSERNLGSRFVFVLDKSGGLGARHFALAKKTVRTAISTLKAGDKFGIVAYDAFAETFRTELVDNTPENIEAAEAWLDKLSSLGASDLSAAWKGAAGLAGKEKTQIVYVGTGMSALTSTKSGRLLKDAENALGEAQVKIHCLPVGSITDTDFLGELARKYSGSMRAISNADDMYANVGDLMQDYGWPLYRNVKVEFEGVEVEEITPQTLANVSAGRQLFIFGKYKNQGKAKVRLTADYEDKPYDKTFDVDFGGNSANTCVAPLWASMKIAALQREGSFAGGDKASSISRAVIALSKRYTVMSQYTSFIVLETPEDYERYGIERRVREFGPYAGTGGVSAAEQLKRLQANAVSNRRSARIEGAAEKSKGFGRGAHDAAPLADRAATGGEKLRSGAPEELRKQLNQLSESGWAREEKRSRKPGAKMEQQLAAKMPPAPQAAAPARSRSVLKKAADKGVARGNIASFLDMDFEESLDVDAVDSTRFRKDMKKLLAWERKDIFPSIARKPRDYTKNWPRHWKHSDAKAMEILRALTARIQSLSATIKTFRVDKEGKENSDGKDWLVELDTKTGRYASYKTGADHKDVCDGKMLTRLFPLLKHAATRETVTQDVKTMASALPGFVMPYVEKLDWEYVVTIEKSEAPAVILRLTKRHRKLEYILLHLESSTGPVVKIETFRQQWDSKARRSTSAHSQTILCEEFKTVNGVRIAAQYRIFTGKVSASTIIREVGGKRIAEKVLKVPEPSPGSGVSSRLVRIENLKINHNPAADLFRTEIPKDWSVLNGDVEPKQKRSISRPVDPSPNNQGRRRRW